MTRAALVAMFALAVGLGTACGKGGGSAKPLLETEQVTRHHVIGNVELDVAVPADMRSANATATDVHYLGGVGDDKLEVVITVGNVTPIQNAINVQEALGHRLSRTDQTADGWAITANDAAGGTLTAQRQLQKEQRAITCSATATWKAPGHDPKRTAFVEAICQSVAPTKF